MSVYRSRIVAGQRGRLRSIALLLAGALGVLGLLARAATPALAAAGTLDPSFGYEGFFFAPVSLRGAQEAFATAVQSDGKIVVVGAGRDLDYTDSDIALWRLTPEGTLDPTFNGVGSAGLSLPGYQWGRAVTIDPLGRIVVAGISVVAPAYHLLVARFTADGKPDLSFNGTGYITGNFGPGSLAVTYAVAVQPDGKILAAGSTGDIIHLDIALARFQADGSPDASFGGGDGFVSTDFGRDGADHAYAIALQKNGRIVLAGESDGTAYPSFALARYLPDGTLDPSFDGDGRVTTDFGGGAYAAAVAIQPDGSIVAAGSAYVSGHPDFAVARYRKNGRLDPTFHQDGKVTTDFSLGQRDDGWGLALQKNGRIVVVGGTQDVPGDDEQSFALARYRKNGSLDPQFGVGGRLITGAPYNDEAAKGVALQQDGKLVVAGSTRRTVAVARYLAE